ncbi:MAG TPA: isoaspartyl peptidase/L-asparaginase [Polyangiaceae bacterium]|nr:isoaspartyl peptidase/L-asparaginase [Polyangiaceae bacterium]
MVAWFSAIGLVGAVWGCRVKRVDRAEPAPSASASGSSVAASTPSPSARASAPVSSPKSRQKPPLPAAPSKHVVEPAPSAPTAPPPAAAAAASAGTELPPFTAAELPPGVAAAALSGPGTDPTRTQGLVNAVRHALRGLTKQSTPLEAAIAGTTIVEDDPLLNAGTGAALRLDGSAELEVLVMDSSGRLGAAAAVRNVQHPVRLALAAATSPHRLLVGDGAQRVAKWLGLPSYDPRTPQQLETYEALVARFSPGAALRTDATVWSATAPGPGASAWQAYLAPPRPRAPPERPDPSVEAPLSAPDAGTPPGGATPAEPPAESSATAVAVLVRAGAGQFAGAIETGGSWLALPGSVGAIATPGAALHVATRGAVALAGPSDRLIAEALARRTYEKLLAYQSARAAAHWALERAQGQPISILVMDALNIVALSNAPTAWAKADPNESTSTASPAEGAPR